MPLSFRQSANFTKFVGRTQVISLERRGARASRADQGVRPTKPCYIEHGNSERGLNGGALAGEGVNGFDGLLEEKFQRGQRAHDHEDLVGEQGSGNPDQRTVDSNEESGESSIAERQGERRRYATNFLDTITGLFEMFTQRVEGEHSSGR